MRDLLPDGLCLGTGGAGCKGTESSPASAHSGSSDEDTTLGSGSAAGRVAQSRVQLVDLFDTACDASVQTDDSMAPLDDCRLLRVGSLP